MIFVADDNDDENADGIKGHLESVGIVDFKPTFYDKYVKRGFDIVVSFCGLVVLSPLLIGISIAIKIDNPGPVFFTQKRVGENKKYFRLYKFRSMKMSTPHDIPTHMLDNPEQYITKVGKFLRAHSLEGNDIIRQTTKSLENKGFREVSPIHFYQGCNLISNELNTVAA